MKRQLAGKTALVTGSTSGIGRAIAERFAQEGAQVVLNGFGDAREIAAMVAEASRVFGHVDILVNNAGIQHVAPVDEFPIEKWDAIIAINLSGAFHATRAVLPGMKQAGWGRIVSIGSIHSLIASPFKSAYVAAKHGMLGFMKAVALEVGHDCSRRRGLGVVRPSAVVRAVVGELLEPRSSRTRSRTSRRPTESRRKTWSATSSSRSSRRRNSSSWRSCRPWSCSCPRMRRRRSPERRSPSTAAGPPASSRMGADTPC